MQITTKNILPEDNVNNITYFITSEHMDWFNKIKPDLSLKNVSTVYEDTYVNMHSLRKIVSLLEEYDLIDNKLDDSKLNTIISMVSKQGLHVPDYITRFPELMNHSDSQGYYIPIEESQYTIQKESVIIGSSNQLLKELSIIEKSNLIQLLYNNLSVLNMNIVEEYYGVPSIELFEKKRIIESAIKLFENLKYFCIDSLLNNKSIQIN